MSEKRFILVVDDDPNITFFFKEYFEDENIDAIITRDPLKAVEIAEQLKPDLLLIDLRMPKMNGFELLKRVREKVPEVKVIIVSSYVESEKDLLCKTKYDEIISKPFEAMDLDRTIMKALDTTKEKLSSKEVISANQKIDILYVDDEVELTDFLRDFFTDYGYVFDVANSGVEGIQLAKKRRYDLIVSDLIMPGMTGVEMIEKMRAEGCHEPGMIAVLSVNLDQGCKDELVKLGVTEYLGKPLGLEELYNWIQSKAEKLIKTR